VEQVGFGSAVWLALSPGVPNLSSCGSRSHARDPARALRFGETGQVPEIEVENLSDSPMLVPAHLVVTGGWQTRAVERSVVVPARSSVRVPVKCVEAGRWAPRDDKSASVFEVSHRAAIRTRWSTSLNMLDQLARHGRFAAEQSAVWQHVEEELSRSPEPSHTRSYEAYLRGVKQQHLDAVRKSGVRPAAGANAVVLFPRCGGFWIDACPTPEALADQAEDLLADLFDNAARIEAEPHDPPSIEALLSLLWSVPLRPVECVTGTLGRAYALSCRLDLGKDGPVLLEPERESGATTAETAFSGLVLEEGLAHLSIGGAPPRAVRQDRIDPKPRDESQGSFRHSSLSAEGRPRSMAEVGPTSRPSIGDLERERQRPGGVQAMGDAVNEGGWSGRLSAADLVAPRAEDPVSQAQPKIGREAMRSIYTRVRDLLPFEPPPREGVSGYRLMRVLEGNVSWVDIRLGGDGYAVLGSHDRCDLVLANDAGIWLRHMIAICVRLEDDTIALRLIDLKTDIPFFLDNDIPQWSVTASGSFAIRLGRHVVCGFPIGSTDGEVPAEPEPAAPVRSHTIESLSRAAMMETSVNEISSPFVRPLRARDEPFTIMPSAPISQIQELMGPSASPNHVRVTLERGGMGASVEIPTDALDAGVLLGRALNCFDGGLRRIFCDAVSRAHVLVLRDHEDVYALDLCTTNGTRVAGRRIRRYRLSNEGSTLELGKKVVFRWHRRRPVDPPPAQGDRSGPVAGQPSEIRRSENEGE
jgi:hypothetical protein